MSEYKTYAIVAVYLEHARIAVAYLGRATVIDDETLELDTRDWRFKAGRSDTYTRRVGFGVGRGAQADPFDARIDKHRRQFWQRVAQAVAQALVDRHIDRAVIGGPEEAATAVRELLPEAARDQVIETVPIPSYATLPEIQERTLPLALADHHRRESELVADLLARVAANQAAVVGRQATFRSLMQGEVKTLVAVRDINGDIWQCQQCQYLSATPIETCPGCGEVAARTPLRQILPILARQHGAGLEVVGPSMFSQLTDGIGALLRYRARHAVA
jgi:peptide subunit release factor 1 (eRF1)